MKINVLAIAAHPDDIELAAAGTLLIHKNRGFTTGIVDLTMGEMGTRGTPEMRVQEAEAAKEVLGLTVRKNLGFADAFFQNDKFHQLEVIKAIREYQPDIIITNATYDRHPDHGRAASLVEEASFKAGLEKIVTTDEEGEKQKPWRPKKVLFSVQSTSLEPDFYVDITDVQDVKMDAIRAYASQFYDPESEEPSTYISSPEFMKMIEARGLEYGHRIGVKYAEGFRVKGHLGVKDLYHLL